MIPYNRPLRGFFVFALIFSSVLSSVIFTTPAKYNQAVIEQTGANPVPADLKDLDSYLIEGEGHDIPTYMLYNLTNEDLSTHDIANPISVNTNGNDIGFTNFTFTDIQVSNASYLLEMTNNHFARNIQDSSINVTYYQQFFLPTDAYVNWVAAYLQSVYPYAVNMSIYNATYSPTLQKYLPDEKIDPTYWKTANAQNLGDGTEERVIAHWEMFDFSSKNILLKYNQTAHSGELATFFVGLRMPYWPTDALCIWYCAEDSFGYGIDAGEALRGIEFASSVGVGTDDNTRTFWQEVKGGPTDDTVDFSMILEIAPANNTPKPTQIGLQVDNVDVPNYQGTNGQYLSWDLKEAIGLSCVYNMTSDWTAFEYFSDVNVTFKVSQMYTVQQEVSPAITYVVNGSKRTVNWNLTLNTLYPPEVILNSTNIEFHFPMDWNVTQVVNITGSTYEPWDEGKAFWYNTTSYNTYNQTVIHNASTGIWLLNAESPVYAFPTYVDSNLSPDGQYYLTNISDVLHLNGSVLYGPNGVPIFKRTDTEGEIISHTVWVGATNGQITKLDASDDTYFSLLTESEGNEQRGVIDLNFSITDTSGMLQSLLNEINISIEQFTLNSSIGLENATDLFSELDSSLNLAGTAINEWDSTFQGVNISMAGENTTSIYFNFTANWLDNVAQENITGLKVSFFHNITQEFIPCDELIQAWNFTSNQWETLDISCLTIGEAQVEGSNNTWRYLVWDSSLDSRSNVSDYINSKNEIWCRWNSSAPKTPFIGNFTEMVDYINLEYTFYNPVDTCNFTVSIYNQTRYQFDAPRNIPIFDQDGLTFFNFAQNVGDYYNVSTNNLQIRLNLTHWAPSEVRAFIDHLYVTINYSQVVTLDWQQDVLNELKAKIFSEQVETYDEAMLNNITFAWDIDSTTLTPGNYSWVTVCSMGNQIAANITDVWVRGLPTAITLHTGDGVKYEADKWVTDPNPYVNDTTKSIRLQVNDTVYGVKLTSVTIETPGWCTGQLLIINEFATTGLEENRGYYRVYLNTTGLANSTAGYDLNLTVSSEIYLSSSVNVTVCVDPLPTVLGVIQQEFTVWENESLQIGASFEDTFHSSLVIGATLSWEVIGGTPTQQGYFSQILYVYDAVIDTQATNITPGEYKIRLTGQKANYSLSIINITLTVNAKNRTVLTTDYSNVGDKILEGTVIGVSATLKYEANDTVIAGVEVEFVFTLSTSSGPEEIKKKGITGTDGIASVEYLIPAGVTSINIAANYAGTGEIAQSESDASGLRVVITPVQQIVNALIEYSPYIIAAIGVIIAISLYVRAQHQKAARFWNTRVAKLNDVLNIQHILVIHKDSGSAILSQTLGTEKIDPNLISGFLTALTSFQSEIAVKKRDVAGKKSFTLDYADFKILLEDGEHVRAALILEAEASDSIKDSLVRFIQRYETRFRKELPVWKGNLKDLEGGENLIEDIFEVSLIYPHVPNPGMNVKKLPRLERAIYEIAKAITKERPFFFMSQLLEYAIAGRKEPKNQIWSVIYDCKKTHLLEPMNVDTTSQ